MRDDHQADLRAALGMIRAQMDDDDRAASYVAAVRVHQAMGLEAPDLDDDEPAGPEADPYGGALWATSNLLGALAELGARLAAGEKLGAIALELAREDTAS